LQSFILFIDLLLQQPGKERGMTEILYLQQFRSRGISTAYLGDASPSKNAFP